MKTQEAETEGSGVQGQLIIIRTHLKKTERL
jgi:hypothetical protein